MKKIQFLILFIFLTSYGFSQVITSIPEKPNPLEPVTIRVDVSSVSVLNGVEPLYIWAWIAGCCDSPTNGQWTDSNEANRMTKVADNIWEISLTSLADFYNQTAGTIGDKINFLVKAKDGTGDIKTNDLELAVSPPPFEDADFRSFPNKFSQEDIITVIYNPELDMESSLPDESEIYMYLTASLKDGGGTVEVSPWGEVGDNPELQLAQQADGRFTKVMVPSRMFNLTEGQEIDEITFVFRNKDGSIQLSDRTKSPFTLLKLEDF